MQTVLKVRFRPTNQQQHWSLFRKDIAVSDSRSLWREISKKSSIVTCHPFASLYLQSLIHHLSKQKVPKNKKAVMELFRAEIQSVKEEQLYPAPPPMTTRRKHMWQDSTCTDPAHPLGSVSANPTVAWNRLCLSSWSALWEKFLWNKQEEFWRVAMKLSQWEGLVLKAVPSSYSTGMLRHEFLHIYSPADDNNTDCHCHTLWPHCYANCFKKIPSLLCNLRISAAQTCNYRFKLQLMQTLTAPAFKLLEGFIVKQEVLLSSPPMPMKLQSRLRRWDAFLKIHRKTGFSE